MARKRLGIVYSVSLLLHAGGGLTLASIRPPPPRREPTKITMHEIKRAPKPPKPETPPPPPPPEAPKRAAPKTPAPKAAAPKAAPPTAAPSAAPAASSSVPDFGLSLGGGGPGGMAIPAAASGGAGPAASKKTLGPKSLTPPTKAANDNCTEELIKAKALDVPQPEYAEAARAAGIAGKVRVELNVDETGQVVSARVLEGLGHGLDEAALQAAKRTRFSPATRCGKATSTTFVIGIRFTL